MMPRAAHPAHLVLGLVVWAAWFVAMYGGLSVACAAAPPPVAAGARTWVNGLLLLLTAFTASALLYAAWRCWLAARASTEAAGAARSRFIPAVSAAVHLSAAVAVLTMGVPAIVLPPCP